MSNYSNSAFNEDSNSSWFKAFEYIKASSKVLDIGCSSGNFGKVLIDKKACIVDGIEPFEADFKIAQKKLRKTYQLNVETDDLSAIKDKYDYLYFGDVIEHLQDPITALKRIKSFLKPSGSLVFSIPNMAHISVRLMLLKGDFEYGETGLLDKTHLHFYTHNEIQRVFGEAGYHVTDLNPVLKDFPEQTLDNQLKKIGLKSTKAFVDFTRTSDASVYQYVGTAKVATKSTKNKKLNISSPIDIFQRDLNATKNYYEKMIASQQAHIAKQDKVIQELSQDLQRIKNHPFNKLLTKANSYKQKSTRK